MWSITELEREFNFLLRRKNVKLLLLFALCLSAFSVTTGLLEIDKQRATLERLLEYDEKDRQDVLEKHSGYGNLGYYTRHLTYTPPSELAFAAIGQRDVMPWKHRVRLLALEGQIYENDADNPELAYVGRIDFTFLIAVLTPLFVILLLHDVRASERAHGRFDLLLTTSHNPDKLWQLRSLVGAMSLMAALLLPFIIGAFISGSAPQHIIAVTGICFAQISFWTLTCHCFGKKPTSAPQIASILLGLWLVTTIVIPVSGDKLIGQMVDSPIGGEISLAQREAVNDAWDLPHEATFEPFIHRHPEWQNHTRMDSNWDWKWYYAFQQVGDQSVETMSQAYRDAIYHKDELASQVAWLSPAMLVQRAMTRLAKTDTQAMLQYEQKIREFHAELRAFYYPYLFKAKRYDESTLQQRPDFSPLD